MIRTSCPEVPAAELKGSREVIPKAASQFKSKTEKSMRRSASYNPPAYADVVGTNFPCSDMSGPHS